MMMRLTVLVLTLSYAASFQIGVGHVVVVREAGAPHSSLTRNRRGMSTMFYANSQEDGYFSRRLPSSSPATQSSHNNNSKQAAEKRGGDEEAVDEYLEFLAKRYR